MSRSAKQQKEDLSLESSIPASSVPLDAILCTEELARRPSRPPDYEKENRALVALASALAESPQTILQKLAETILEITESDSSGVSLLTTDGTRFYWPALAGRWTPHIGEGTPRDFGPCGDVLDRNMPLLMRHWEWRYTYFAPISPPVEEGLLVPFYLGGKAVGTIWVVMHDDHRKFDAEDERVLTGLSKFASTAYQALASIEDLKLQVAARERAEAALLKLTEGLEAQVRVRTQQLELQVQVLQNIPVNAWTVLPDGMQDFTNQQWLEYTGLTMERFLSSPQAWMNALHPDDRERAATAFWGGIRSGSAFTSETRFRRISDGEYRWHLNRGIPLRDSAGNLIKFVGTSTDIEDVKRAEEALRASERDVRLIVDTIPGMVCTLKADWEVEFVNKPLREYFGKTLEELKDWEFIGVVHPDDIERVVAKTRHSSATGEPYEVEHRCLRHDGVFRWFQVRAMPLRDAAGHLVRWYLLLTDIEDRKRAEEALRLQVEVLQYMPAAAWTLLPDGATDFANQQWLEYTGQSLEYKRSSPGAWMTALHPDDLERAAATYWEGIRSGKATTVETRFRRSSDGEYRWHLNRAIPLRDSSGKLIKFVGTSTDIEDLKRAERELRQLIDFLPQHVVVLDKDGALLNANKTMLDYMGLTLEEMKGGGTRERINRDLHPDERESVQKERSAGLSRGMPFESEKRLLGKDGRYRWFLFRYNPLLNEAGDIVRWFVAATDIEDRKQAEDRMRNETIALREQIDRESMFEEIVGSSPALQAVLEKVVKVAPTDSTVLISGETGTGKELIARAIHKRSKRSGHAFISVNCASIPSSLIASELFGHEKGAFTGALQQRQGRFELANGGTIFLDEIGELPAETQIALLRVLQERQFERVGGSKAISVDVRVITATNRDLSAAIAAGTFRADLFYRLNVFPIQVPPLRLRRDDIPVLVEYFVKRFAEKMGKQINRIDKGTIELCEKYPWPGNIRELQNIVERSVILCGGNTFSIDEAWLSVNTSSSVSVTRPMGETLQDHEREIIEAALAESKGRVAGPNGAAVKLGIPRSTLDRKIQQLKIKKREFLPE